MSCQKTNEIAARDLLISARRLENQEKNYKNWETGTKQSKPGESRVLLTNIWI